jgi:hypothetical protein
MKKTIIALLPLCLLAACTKNLTSLNVDPKSPTSVPSAALFTNAQRVLTNTVTSSNVNLNIFRLIEQQWQETTYTDESNYDIKTRPIPDDIWNAMYRDVLENLEQTKAAIPKDVQDPIAQKNDIATTDIMEVYSYYYLVTTFGNIPYTDALNYQNTFPKFDDAKTVFGALLTRLDADIAALNTSGGGFGSADIIYAGDPGMWKKFANSLKLKMGITIAITDPVKSKTVVESAAAGVFTSNADNATFAYQSAPPNTNPIWVDLVQSGRQDFIANSTLVNQLKAFSDPRLGLFFTTDATGGYSGGNPGQSSNYSTFSKPATAITSPTFPGLLLDYAETEFNLSEAAARGYNVSGTAASHYNNAITASIAYWGGTSAAASTYLLLPSVNYLTAAGTYQQKIGVQKWIALYNRGWDAWIDTRRLGFPTLVAPSSALTVFPLRFTYPVKEQNVNGVNYAAAATAIGGDVVATKLFF